MFGHNPDDQHHDENAEHNMPQPDQALGNEQGAPDLPPVPPAPMDNGDSAGDFLMEDGPAEHPHDQAADIVAPASAGLPAAEGSDVDELLRIKQEAIQALAPMVGHLDQKPRDEFRTIMMMIQATDNAHLIPSAYAAAQKLMDEKERAQAFLDIINEINYFTQTDDAKAA